MCDQCGTVADDAFTSSLGLPISISRPEGLSLIEYLRAYHADSVQVDCQSDACIAERAVEIESDDEDAEPFVNTRSRTYKIVDSPDILVIQLMRYDTVIIGQNKDGEDVFETRKLTTAVPFDEQLDLSEFADDDEGVLKYRLFGVVGHDGLDIKSGHYVAAVRRRDGKGFATISDTNIEDPPGSDITRLQRPRFGKVDFPAYMLLYQRVED